jgi:hypothetical protein
MMDEENDTHLAALEVHAVVVKIRPLLAGREPAIQGAILADLLGYWLAGHAPGDRAAILQGHLEFVEFFTRTNAFELRGETFEPTA